MVKVSFLFILVNYHISSDSWIYYFLCNKTPELKMHTLWYLYRVHPESTQHTKKAKLIDVNEAEKHKNSPRRWRKNQSSREEMRRQNGRRWGTQRNLWEMILIIKKYEII